MYAGNVEDREGRLNFTVSGMLWKRSLVMRDEETGSLWSHQLGRAMQGELQGAQLEVLPSTMTDWASWRARNPETTVTQYRRTADRFVRSFQKVHAKYVLGLEHAGAVRAYPYATVAETGVVNDELGGEPVLLTYDPAGACASAFARRLPGGAGEDVTFAAVGERQMRDSVAGSLWDRQSGVASTGGLKGKKLQRLPGIPSYRGAWEDFHPDGSVYGE